MLISFLSYDIHVSNVSTPVYLTKLISIFQICFPVTIIRVEDAYVDNWIEFIPTDALIIQPSKHNNVRLIRDAEVITTQGIT